MTWLAPVSDWDAEAALRRCPRKPNESLLDGFERVLRDEGLTGIPDHTLPYREAGDEG